MCCRQGSPRSPAACASRARTRWAGREHPIGQAAFVHQGDQMRMVAQPVPQGARDGRHALLGRALRRPEPAESGRGDNQLPSVRACLSRTRTAVTVP